MGRGSTPKLGLGLPLSTTSALCAKAVQPADGSDIGPIGRLPRSSVATPDAGTRRGCIVHPPGTPPEPDGSPAEGLGAMLGVGVHGSNYVPTYYHFGDNVAWHSGVARRLTMLAS